MSDLKFWRCLPADGTPAELPATQEDLDKVVDENVGEALQHYITGGHVVLSHREPFIPQIRFFLLDHDQIECAVDLQDILRLHVESQQYPDGTYDDDPSPLDDLERKLLLCIVDWEEHWNAKYPDWRK